MGRIIEYRIIRLINIDELEAVVNIQINNFWEPVGGVSVDGYYYCQALVMREWTGSNNEP